ncbi:hypothetical protein CHS0354_005284 [Potamilus streckersoni]|uniref:HECT domain-containing protein n=1 Tax=Potamilus streckersoni TaxID=2493646 RepID=A0AAE0WBB1_9BIVA|nr:hypothetical protein CHS0354_005284 [Potamilus streckersoni]
MGNSQATPTRSHVPVPSTSKENEITTLAGTLEEMRRSLRKVKYVLHVERLELFPCSLAYLKNEEYDNCPIDVVMSTNGQKEEVLNSGGPNREYFSLLFKEFLKKEHDLFEGHSEGRNLLPTNNEKALSHKYYYFMGKSIVLSLLNGGPGFPYLAPCVVSYIKGEEYMDNLNIGIVYNTLLRHFIRRINAAKNEEELLSVLEDDSERFVDNCGWPKNEMITMKNRLELTQILLKWELIGKRVAALDQLRSGLNVLDLLNRTKHMPEFNKILMTTNVEKVTASYLKTHLKKAVMELEAGNPSEKAAKKHTLACLKILTDEEATELFHFITGMSEPPVEDLPIEVEFNRTNPKSQLPEALTCIQCLRIPLGNDTQVQFISSFNKAMSMGRYGFSSRDSNSRI